MKRVFTIFFCAKGHQYHPLVRGRVARIAESVQNWRQKRDRFCRILSSLKRAAKNASIKRKPQTQAPNATTNGGDASRVGIMKRKDTNSTK